jgi:hypothetical protein
MLGVEAHAYERDLHLILTSRPWSLSGSTLMETALKPNPRPSTASSNKRRYARRIAANIAKLLELLRKP